MAGAGPAPPGGDPAAGPPGVGDVFVRGALLAAVQGEGVYADCKHFVDMPLKAGASPRGVLEAFGRLPRDAGGRPARPALEAFLAEHFDAPAGALEPAALADWRPEPPGFLPRVAHPRVREWALNVHALWRLLGRRQHGAAGAGTLLPQGRPMVVPGERFRETYYWDSYWVLEGLLVSGMHETATGVVENLLQLLEAHGFVPNGSRLYYLNRSQPPLLSQMVRSLERHGVAGAGDLARRALPLLVREHAFMTGGRRSLALEDAAGRSHTLARYFCDVEAPRPESWREDVAAAAPLGEAARAALFSEIAAAAESGWDFSSRWMADGASLATLRTSKVVPVDLNVFLLLLEENVAHFAGAAGEAGTAAAFGARARARREAIEALMWDGDHLQWRDLIVEEVDVRFARAFAQSRGVYASNFVPLWAGCGGDRAAGVHGALLASGLVGPGGIATSLAASGQQWDFPNAWPPLQHMLIEGVARTDEALARRLARAYLRNCHLTYLETGMMHEKYDATRPGHGGGGGEYRCQVGFGWTNGVALSLLDTFGWPEDEGDGEDGEDGEGEEGGAGG